MNRRNFVKSVAGAAGAVAAAGVGLPMLVQGETVAAVRVPFRQYTGSRGNFVSLAKPSSEYAKHYAREMCRIWEETGNLIHNNEQGQQIKKIRPFFLARPSDINVDEYGQFK